MAALDDTRRARACLAWLFEPTDPRLQDLANLHGPVAAWQLLADYDLDRGDVGHDIPRLRAEVRGTHRPSPSPARAVAMNLLMSRDGRASRSPKRLVPDG